MAHKRFVDGVGFVSVLQWTTDDEILRIARATYGNELSRENLMRFIMKHNHDSIFEMAHFMFHIKMPGTAAQQHHQTRLGNFHHLTDFPGEAYASPGMVQELGEMQDFAYRTSSSIYSIMKDHGVPDRDACMHIPVSTYTDFYWKVNGKELMDYISKFSSVSDKYLIKQYASAIQAVTAPIAPVLIATFSECRLNTITLDTREMNKLAQLVTDTDGAKFTLRDMSKSDVKQFKKKINRLINGNA
jgi:thymidylate synthase (FAD)